MSKLVVYYQEKVVGHLHFNKEERLIFQYDKSWLAFKDRFSLSLAINLAEKVYCHLETKSFFENLLPDVEIKDLYRGPWKELE